MRYRPENIRLVGIIPGQREPELTVNFYIDPLIEELYSYGRVLTFV